MRRCALVEREGGSTARTGTPADCSRSSALRSGRWAFWFPLTIGVVAAAAYLFILMAVSFADPYLLPAIQSQMMPGT